MKLDIDFFKKAIEFSTNNIVIILLLSFWSLIWFSINTNFYDIFYIGDSLFKTINGFRILLPITLTYLTSGYLIFYFLKYGKSKIKIFNNIVFIFYLYFLFQIIGLYLNDIKEFNQGNFFLVLLCVGTLNTLLLVKIFNLEKYNNLFLIISIFILFVVMLSVLTLKGSSIISSLQSLSLYTITGSNENFIGGMLPKSTGLSRTLGLISLFFFIYYCNSLKNYRYLFLIIVIFLATLVWALQSRGGIISFWVAGTFFILFFTEKIKNKMLNIFILFIIPIIIFNYVLTQSKKFHVKIEILNEEMSEMSVEPKNSLGDKKPKIIIGDNTKENTYVDNDGDGIFDTLIFIDHKGNVLNLEIGKPLSRFTSHGLTSSGRLEIWKYVLGYYDKSKIFGYGSQADRHFLIESISSTDNKVKLKFPYYGSNVSNAAIYGFLSGGYLSLIVFGIIYIRVFFIIFKLFSNKKKLSSNDNFLFKISFTFIVFLSTRGLIENSFAVFSIDFLLFAISLFSLSTIYKNNKSRI
jgi:O-antigen ligase